MNTQAASLFFAQEGRVLPHGQPPIDNALLELALDLAIEQQRHEIEWALAHRCLQQGGLERSQHEPHKLTDVGSNPTPATTFLAAAGSQHVAEPVSIPGDSPAAAMLCGPDFKPSSPEALINSSTAPQQAVCNGSRPAPLLAHLCSWCSRVFNSARGEYLEPGQYRVPEQWSHGICPGCLSEQLKELEARA